MPGEEPTCDDLLALLKWMALPYGTNEPVFAASLPTGRPLESNIRLQATWRAIFGERKVIPGEWRQCPECRTWYVHAPGSDRRLNGHDIEVLARAMVDGV